MRQKNENYIIDYVADGKKSSISVPVALVHLASVTREGGMEETVKFIRNLAIKGKSSREAVAGICVSLRLQIQAFCQDFEHMTGEKALPHLSGHVRREALENTIRRLAELRDDATI